MARSADSNMARLCGQLMSTAQGALDSINYAIEEMEYALEANPERDDIKACIEEAKAINKAAESKNWVTANHWAEHFDGVSNEVEEDTEETETRDKEEDNLEDDTDTEK